MAVASLVLALLVGAAFAVLLIAISDLRTSGRLVARSRSTNAAADRLEELVIDLETGVRGYVASGARPVFLQPYTEARQAYPAQGRALASLVRDNPIASDTVGGIRGSIDDYVNLYSIPMISLARDRIDVARSVIVNGTGPQRIDAIRSQFQQLFNSERAVANKRTSQASSRANVAIWIGIGGLVFGLSAKQPVAIDDARPIATSFPDFVPLMNRLGAQFTKEG